MKLPIYLPSFHYLISPRIGSSSRQTPSSSQSQVAQKTPLLCQPWRSLLPLTPTPSEILPLPLLLLLPPSLLLPSTPSQKVGSRRRSGTRQQRMKHWLF